MSAGVPPPAAPVLACDRLSVRFGSKTALSEVSLAVPANKIMSVIGPAGCGKTSLLRAFNRTNELIAGARTTGTALYRGADLYARAVDPVEVRRRIGMVFQRATPFPKSVFDNVAFGLRAGGWKGDLHERCEAALAAAGLWDDFADELDAPALALSAGQQQQLCIARTLAVRPDILLMDEPTASLDPGATARLESLVHSLKATYTIVLVTHDLPQAARLSDLTAFLQGGELVECSPTATMFTNPLTRRAEEYVTGRAQ